ncbi:MAG TPA: PAS domain S-box protein [Blastocatellia bacterium]|nr:PAS domain S-box protein [Blastocatellia bacterium]
MNERNLTILKRYGVALLSVAIATVMRMALNPLLGGRTTFITYFLALVVTAWYGGLMPALVVVALGAVFSAFFFLPPENSLLVTDPGALLSLLLFIISGTAVALFSGALHRSVRKATESARAVQVWRQVFEHARWGIVIANPAEGRLEAVNSAYADMHGYAVEEMKGMPLIDTIAPEARKDWDRNVRVTHEKGHNIYESLHTRKDGSRFPVLMDIAVIKDEAGYVLYRTANVQDLTERKRAEEALKQSEERYRELFENANDIIYTLDLEGNLTSVNKAGERITGYSREELLNKPIASIVAPEYMEKMAEMLSRKVEGETLTAYDLEIVSKDGRRLTLEIGSRLIINDGKAIGVQGMARDITERRRAEQALRESEERFAKAFNASPLVLTISSLTTGRLIAVNETFINLSGYSREEVIGKTTAELGLWGSLRDREEELKAVRDVGQVRNVEYIFKTRRGEELVGLLSAERIEIGGEPSALTVIQDITDRKRAEEAREESLKREQAARAEAESANRAKDEFLATVSHELRTPLNAILGWSQMLRTSKLNEATAARALETIERNARAQTQLVEDILDVSRIITGKLRLDVRPVELSPVIESAIDSIRPAIEAKGLRLETALDPQAGPVSGDPARLQQVVWNLLSNAVKFTERGGRVQVRLERVNSHAEITVSDTGCGIRTDFLPHVFDRFRQADGTSTRLHGGLGLGLAIVRHMVEMHGGAVEAFSQGEGLGARFTVKLPLMIAHKEFRPADRKHPAATTGARFEQPAILGGLRLLVVDDERDTRDLLVLILAGFGAEVKTCGSCSEAMRLLAEWKPDVVVSDIEMPGEDGYTFIRQVRSLDSARARNTPAVALTAYARVEDRMRALAAGFQMHVAKPVEPAELAVVIASVAERTSREPS